MVFWYKPTPDTVRLSFDATAPASIPGLEWAKQQINRQKKKKKAQVSSYKNHVCVHVSTEITQGCVQITMAILLLSIFLFYFLPDNIDSPLLVLTNCSWLPTSTVFFCFKLFFEQAK